VLITAANIDEGLAKTSHMHFPFCCFSFLQAQHESMLIPTINKPNLRLKQSKQAE
jgi:hypothetical protein